MFDHRAVVVGQTRDELLAVGQVAGRRRLGGRCWRRRAVFRLRSGLAVAGMGSELCATTWFSPSLDAVVDELDRTCGIRCRDLGHQNNTDPPSRRCFAEVALYRPLMSWGCGRLRWVIRWAIGRGARRRAVFAGCGDAGGRATVDGSVAGGAMFAAARSRGSADAGGTMCIAAVNGPASVVISAPTMLIGCCAWPGPPGPPVGGLACLHLGAMIAEFTAVAAELSVACPRSRSALM